jgi:methylenetetrahydrofolate reductase (NADPH)
MDGFAALTRSLAPGTGTGCVIRIQTRASQGSGRRKARAVGRIPFSFEVYPPRTDDGHESLYVAVDELVKAGPEFISVTYGASGSTRERSLAILRHLVDRGDVRTMAHITCVGATRAETAERIAEILAIGVTSFLAVRGDPPEGVTDENAFLGDLHNATELVEMIHAAVANDTRAFEVAVAAFPNGHPRSASRREDIDTLLAKQAAGAQLAITQLFFEADDYLGFVDEARTAGVTLPIRPGIMPVLSLGRLKRMLELSGERTPRDLAADLAAATSPEHARAIGVEACTVLAADLIAGGAPAIHICAFNQSEPALEVLANLGARAGSNAP